MDSAIFTKIPVIPPPSGTVSNFVNPQTRAPIVVALTTTFLALTWIVFLLRLYSKTFILRKFSWDDVTSSIAMIGLTITSGFIFDEMTVLGPHGWDISVAKYLTPTVPEGAVIISISASILAFFVRLSLLLLYLQVFAPKSWFRYASYVGMIFCAILFGGIAIAIGVVCAPRAGESWIQVLESPRCTRATPAEAIVAGIASVLSDLYIFIIPIPVISRLNLSTKKKIGVIAVFSTGFFAIIVSIVGFYYRIGLAFDVDTLWVLPITLLCTIVEINAGLLCANMPYLPPIFRKTKNPKRGCSFLPVRNPFALLSKRRGSEDQTPVLPRHKGSVNSRDDLYVSKSEVEQVRFENRTQQADQV